jgi:hypothetical protein
MDALRKPDAVHEDESNRLILHAGRTMWDAAPQLLFMSMLLMIGAFPALYLATATSWTIAWPLLMVCTAPVWAGTIAACAWLLDGDVVSTRQVLALIRCHGLAGVRIGLVPAVVGTILIGSIGILDRQSDAAWVAVPLLVTLGIAIVVGLALVPIFAIATTRALPGVDLWLASAGLAFRRPIPVLGMATLFGLVFWVASIIGPVALLALAPLAVLNAAVVREMLGDRTSQPEPR